MSPGKGTELRKRKRKKRRRSKEELIGNYLIDSGKWGTGGWPESSMAERHLIKGQFACLSAPFAHSWHGDTLPVGAVPQFAKRWLDLPAKNASSRFINP